jgi:hypothetical protein
VKAFPAPLGAGTAGIGLAVNRIRTVCRNHQWAANTFMGNNAMTDGGDWADGESIALVSAADYNFRRCPVESNGAWK